MAIESSVLPAEAVSYLNEVETNKSKVEQEMALHGAKTDLLSFCNSFIDKSAAWRKSSYETKWDKWQRAADAIFDPDISSKKESWQSRVFVPITPSHRETIHAHLFKTMIGVNPPLEVKARYDIGSEDQAENIQALILRELDKANWGVVMDDVFHDADTFGSGFVRMSYKTQIEKRKLRKEKVEGIMDNFDPMGLVGYAKRAVMGELKKTYEYVEQDVLVYRGLHLCHYSIWDIFPDPKALKVKGNPIACRYWATYEDLVKGVQEGYYLESCLTDLKNIKEVRKYPEGQDTTQSNRDIADHNTEKTEYQQEYELYEFFARLPKKWVYKIMGQEFEGDGEELVPARVIFHKNSLVAVEINDDYEGEAPIYKLDYMHRNGSFYGVGVPEMLEGSQAVINEVVNQRLDNGAMALNNTFAVIEKALINPKQDLVNKPGQVIRLDSKYVPNGDVRNALTQLNINDTPVRSGFSEVNEAERWAQERTSANRVTLGTAGLVKDANQTLGGQQILRESAGEKFAYVGLKMELDFEQSFFRGVWKTIYNHIEFDDILDALGPEKAQTFILVNPEEIVRDYSFKTMGVFTMENKAMRNAQLLSLRKEFIGAPWQDEEKIWDAAFRNIDEDPDRFRKTEQQILMEQAQQIVPEGGMPPTDTTGQPMPTSGPSMPIPTQVTAAEAEMSPDDIKAAYKSGAMTRDMAVSLLKDKHGYL